MLGQRAIVKASQGRISFHRVVPACRVMAGRTGRSAVAVVTGGNRAAGLRARGVRAGGSERWVMVVRSSGGSQCLGG
jgi:hypothetical protein